MDMMLVPRRNFDLFDDIFDDSFFMPKNDNKMMRTDIEEKDNNYELTMFILFIIFTFLFSMNC